MNRTLSAFLVTPLLALAAPALQAQDAAVPDAVTAATAKLMPDMAPSWVKPAPLQGLWEVAFGPHIFYISADGQYLLRGDIMKLDSRENLTRPARNKARLDAVESLEEASMIVFSPPQAARHTVTVFTDVECGYCAKLHAEMQSYLDKGIAVRYVAFPRAGVGSQTYDTMVSVWCADDPHKAMTQAKAGQPVAPKSCPNPVAAHYEMGQLVGVRGTPTIVLDNGDMVPGYLPAQRLLEALEQAAVESKG